MINAGGRSIPPEPATPAQQVAILADLYSKRAEAYDALWSPVIRPLGELLLDNLPLSRARAVIDVGCGAGALLPLIRSRAPGAMVLGVDRSAGMLSVAVAKGAGPLALMDAQQLAARTGSFDVAVLAFMLFHLPAPSDCLSEVARLLRKEGKVGVSTWAEEEVPAANVVWDEELVAAGARPPELPAVDNDALCDTPEKLGALLTQAGLSPERVWTESIEHRWPPADHFEWHLQSTSRLRLASLEPEVRAACLARVRDRLAGMGPEQYVFRGEVILAVAAKRETPAS